MTDLRKDQMPIEQFKHHEKDTGSIEIQIISLTEKIKRLTLHFQENPKDHASKRGMVQMVASRKKSLAYLQAHHPENYKKLIEQLGLRK